MKKFIITEDEKKEIRKLYGNVFEQIDTSKMIQQLIDYTIEKIEDDKKDDSESESDESDESSNVVSPNKISIDSDFSKITDFVIEKFEGGYWNPFCDNHPQKGMGISTETMFGLDRYNGNIESTPEGKEFFKIIDNEKYDFGAHSYGSGKNMKWTNMSDFCQKWTWNYKGGSDKEPLKKLAVNIMKGYFDKNLNNFVSDSKTKEKIKSNPGLLLHMIYASWNGPGYFKKFAQSISDGVNKGKTDKELIDLVTKDRLNSNLYHQDKVNSEIRNLS